MRLITPITGRLWDAVPRDLPPVVVVGSRVFVKARWWRPYPGVVCQYREARPLLSAHLFVHPDGTFTVDHIDDYNPDMGYPLQHFVVDLLRL